MHLKRTKNVRFGDIVERSPFLSWTDGPAIKTPDQSQEFDTTCSGTGNFRDWPAECGNAQDMGSPFGITARGRKSRPVHPAPIQSPSRTAIRLVVLIANGTSDFASERSDAKSYVRNRRDGPDTLGVNQAHRHPLGKP